MFDFYLLLITDSFYFRYVKFIAIILIIQNLLNRLGILQEIQLRKHQRYQYYIKILETYFHLGIGSFGVKLTVLHWINDVLMAIFFFLVSLEIKREFVQGELSKPKQAMLPIIGAVGGMLVPALVYIVINIDDSSRLNGWAIPSATDIAFSLGVLSLLGKKVPISLKIFLTALAIIDDLGAIVIIAFFYSGNIQINLRDN